MPDVAADKPVGFLPRSAPPPGLRRPAHPKPMGQRAAPTEDRLALGLFSLLLVSIVVLQKVALPGNIELVLVIAWAAFLFTAVFMRTGIDVGRFALFGVFAALAIGTQFFQSRFSQNSLLLTLALHGLLCFKIYVTPDTYLKMMRLFVLIMIAIAAIVALQHLIQFTVGVKYWVNLDAILPPMFQFKTYNYMQPMEWRGGVYKPNGIFFLETSILSQYLALGLLVEFLFFRRPLVLGALFAALLATFGGTGLMLLCVVGPFVLMKLGTRGLLLLAPILLLIVGVAARFGWLDVIQGRIGTFGMEGRSANDRFVAPAVYIVELVKRGPEALIGAGAGNIAQTSDQVWWAITKVWAEYGLLAVSALSVFMVYSLFKGAPSKTLALGCLAIYGFLNGYGTPLTAVTCVCMVTLFHLRPAGLEELKARLPS